MEIINYTEARANLSSIMDKAVNNHTPIAITRQKGKPVIMISLEDYNTWQETSYLMASEANRKRLFESVGSETIGKTLSLEDLEKL